MSKSQPSTKSTNPNNSHSSNDSQQLPDDTLFKDMERFMPTTKMIPGDSLEGYRRPKRQKSYSSGIYFHNDQTDTSSSEDDHLSSDSAGIHNDNCPEVSLNSKVNFGKNTSQKKFSFIDYKTTQPLTTSYSKPSPVYTPVPAQLPNKKTKIVKGNRVENIGIMIQWLSKYEEDKNISILMKDLENNKNKNKINNFSLFPNEKEKEKENFEKIKVFDFEKNKKQKKSFPFSIQTNKTKNNKTKNIEEEIKEFEISSSSFFPNSSLIQNKNKNINKNNSQINNNEKEIKEFEISSSPFFKNSPLPQNKNKIINKNNEKELKELKNKILFLTSQNSIQEQKITSLTIENNSLKQDVSSVEHLIHQYKDEVQKENNLEQIRIQNNSEIINKKLFQFQKKFEKFSKNFLKIKILQKNFSKIFNNLKNGISILTKNISVRREISLLSVERMKVIKNDISRVGERIVEMENVMGEEREGRLKAEESNQKYILLLESYAKLENNNFSSFSSLENKNNFEKKEKNNFEKNNFEKDNFEKDKVREAISNLLSALDINNLKNYNNLNNSNNSNLNNSNNSFENNNENNDSSNVMSKLEQTLRDFNITLSNIKTPITPDINTGGIWSLANALSANVNKGKLYGRSVREQSDVRAHLEF